MPVALPASMPRQLLAGHERQSADIAEPVEFESGEPRLAPIARSVPTVMPVRWSLTQAQFDDYDEWFETDLRAGSLSFTLPIPSEGGDATVATSVEAMFLDPPIETQRARGNWLVEGRVVTGVSFELPTDGPCITENFGGGIGAYSAVTGTDAAFSVTSGVLSAVTGGPNLSEIRRPFSAREVVTVAFKFRLTSLNSDDACIFRLLAGGVQALAFWPRRELLLSSGVGSAHATVGISGSIGGVTPAALAVDTDYQFELAIVPGIGASTLDITRISDSAVIASNALAGELAGSMPGVNALGFLIDDGGATLSETDYWDINICAVEP